MEIQPVDLSALAAIVLGSLVVLIPIMGATARFAAKPLIDALVQSGLLGARSTPAVDSVDLGRLSRRVLELEQELARLKAPQLTDVRAIKAPGGDDVGRQTDPQPVELRRVRT